MRDARLASTSCTLACGLRASRGGAIAATTLPPHTPSELRSLATSYTVSAIDKDGTIQVRRLRRTLHLNLARRREPWNGSVGKRMRKSCTYPGRPVALALARSIEYSAANNTVKSPVCHITAAVDQDIQCWR